jgi:hypothetical protein
MIIIWSVEILSALIKISARKQLFIISSSVEYMIF